MNKVYTSFLLILAFCSVAHAQHSVARKWNEAILEGVRNDFARPTVHARNLFHMSAAMYDAWNAYNGSGEFYLLGKTVNGFQCRYNGIDQPDTEAELQAAQEEAISYAVYRLMKHRFQLSPQGFETNSIIDNLMAELGYDKNFGSTNLEFGSPAALGNYIAQCYIDYGLQDGSNEEIDYQNVFYSPINDPLLPINPGNPTITNANRWQPLTLEVFIDQAGNEIPGATPGFLSPEWGTVLPFALTEEDLTIFSRNNNEYWVYHDPTDPPYLEADGSGLSSEYQWGFSLVSIWGSHLDPTDGVMWDISPGALGNIGVIDNYPTELGTYSNFYNKLEGGDIGIGRATNPKTGEPYAPNIVPRGDYARVLAEFWADGPDSETPPGHWFTILNKVNDHPALEKRFKGEGEILSDLEWDVKAYFTLGGAMHDCAISAWGIKGWYDYIRPISAIRYMADQGQSSDINLPNYAASGMPLEPGLIELVETGDPLAGSADENIGKIKLYTWRGPDYITNPETDVAGVGWILAENWWPFQRPSFITPNFAGYLSGHSTYSRAAAEILTMLTGDEYFPGGVGEFIAPQNEFLVFEEGPSVDVTLQWATYRDASDQTSLSRIWGGIHPPADDIRGRIIGNEIAEDAFALAERYFLKIVTSTDSNEKSTRALQVFPNPSSEYLIIQSANLRVNSIRIVDIQGRVVLSAINPPSRISLENLTTGTYILEAQTDKGNEQHKIIITK